MRISLILALLLALGAVVFALQNPGYTDLQIGTYDLHASTALMLIVAIAFGAVVASMVMIPGRLKKRKEVKHLKQALRDVTGMKSAASSLVNDSTYDEIDQHSMDSFPASDPQSASSLTRSNHKKG